MCKHGTTVDMEIGGQPVRVDHCIAGIVRALNDLGIPTVASCCGHGKMHGVISLEDGRELVIMSIEDREKHFQQFPHTIHGEPLFPPAQREPGEAKEGDDVR